jgi:ubiquitin-conjugating enzyme E2 variant
LIRSPREALASKPAPTGGNSAHDTPLACAPAGAQPPRAIALTALDACSVAVFAALVGALVQRLIEAPWSPGGVLVLCACAVVGYAAADLMSGVIHWFGDTFFAEDTPVIGSAFIHPFREHHRDPLAITRHGFLEVNGNNCFALLPLLLPTWLLGAPAESGDPVPWLPFQAAALFFSIATFGTNQFHKWAHQPGPPARPIEWLRRAHLILDPEHHAGHHRAPHRSSYCVTVGWLNPLLDALGAFGRAERAIRSLARQPRTPSAQGDERAAVARPAGPDSR